LVRVYEAINAAAQRRGQREAQKAAGLGHEAVIRSTERPFDLHAMKILSIKRASGVHNERSSSEFQ
jgi:hypothetical protein